MSSSNKLYLPVHELYFADLDFLRKNHDIGSIMHLSPIFFKSFIEGCDTKNLTSSTVRR